MATTLACLFVGLRRLLVTSCCANYLALPVRRLVKDCLQDSIWDKLALLEASDRTQPLHSGELSSFFFEKIALPDMSNRAKSVLI